MEVVFWGKLVFSYSERVKGIFREGDENVCSFRIEEEFLRV